MKLPAIPFLRLAFLLLCFSPVFSASSQAQEKDPLYRQTSDVHHLMVQLQADEGSLNRFYFMKNSP